ncbi:ATP synthase subunit 6 [Bradyrhizobium diazoefficiens]
MKIDPIHQFNIEPLFTIGHIGHQTIAFTNSSLYMLIAVAIISLLMLASGAQLVPGRLQSVAEISYEFVASTIRSTAGSEGMKFFPLIFSLFMFICVSNLIGIIPYTFTISSHLIVTAALALLVFFTVLIYGVAKNGLKFFSIFVPHGVPGYILPLVMFIEILSFFLRPVSHSVRLFANMLAGHIALKVFAGFVAMLGFSLGALGWVGGVLPLALTVALYALEILVAFLQALCVCDPDLHLPQRRHSSGTLSGPGNFHPQPNLSSKESKMDPAAAKLIGAGIACIGMGGAGVGVGVIFGNYLAAAVRNPSAAQGQFGNLIFGFAVTEALGIFSLLIALLLLFVPL